jgi:hypothetical protein
MMRSAGVRRAPAVLLLFIAAPLSLVCSAGALSQQRGSKRSAQTYAVVSGTVFRDDGRAMQGAEVTLKPIPEDGSRTKQKALSVTTDSRGEFAVRVPASPMRYTVVVKANGFRTQEKTASISGDERADIFVQLERETPRD